VPHRRRRYRVRAGDLQSIAVELLLAVWIKAAPEEHMARVAAQGDLRPMAGHAEAIGGSAQYPDSPRVTVRQGRRRGGYFGYVRSR